MVPGTGEAHGQSQFNALNYRMRVPCTLALKLYTLSAKCLYVLRMTVTVSRIKRLVFVIETDVSSVRRELNVYNRA